MSERPVVLLTNPIHPEAEAMLAEYARPVTAPDPSPETLRALVAEAEGLVVRVKLPDDILEDATRLRGIVRHGVGLDMIPVVAATARGIPVANLPGSNTQAVAEYVFAALFHLRRQVWRLDGGLRAEGWGAVRPIADGLAEIGGGTLGVLGLGEIGGRVARIAHHGFGMRVLGASRSGATLGGLVPAVDLETLFAQSDAVVIACPLTEATRGLVDAALIGRMRPDAVLINVARGPVVETVALAAAPANRRARRRGTRRVRCAAVGLRSPAPGLPEPAADPACGWHHPNELARHERRRRRGDAAHPARRATAQSRQSRNLVQDPIRLRG